MASTTRGPNFQTSPIHHPPIHPTVPTQPQYTQKNSTPRACPCQFKALPIVRKFKGLLSEKPKNDGILCGDLPLESKKNALYKQIQVLGSAFKKDTERTINCRKLLQDVNPFNHMNSQGFTIFLHDGPKVIIPSWFLSFTHRKSFDFRCRFMSEGGKYNQIHTAKILQT